MKVIMLQDVGGVGQRGKVVEVSDGYALNFLIPQRKAEQATPEKEAQAMKRLEAEASQRESAASALRAVLETLNGQEVVMTAKASEKGGLFKSVSANDISALVKKSRGIEISANQIHLEKPIKEIGAYSISLGNEKAASTMRLIVKPE